MCPERDGKNYGGPIRGGDGKIVQQEVREKNSAHRSSQLGVGRTIVPSGGYRG